MSRATVIIPTYGYAPFLKNALACARDQTVADIEICVILDGSPPEVETLALSIADQNSDSRIQVFRFPKGCRTGEEHRAKVIPHTSGRIICYLGHDDLWFPNHVERMEALLSKVDFGHSLHVNMGLRDRRAEVLKTFIVDISKEEYRSLLCNEKVNRFGLTFGAHTRTAYDSLPEGWATTPKGIWTDLHMWRKFLNQPKIEAATLFEVTALHFPKKQWESEITHDELAAELTAYQDLMLDKSFHEHITKQAFEMLDRAKKDSQKL